jgi:hypothetical protein
MTAATIGGGRELFDKQGTPFWTSLAAAVFCASLAAIGLAMAIRKVKPLEESPERHAPRP